MRKIRLLQQGTEGRLYGRTAEGGLPRGPGRRRLFAVCGLGLRKRQVLPVQERGGRRYEKPRRAI